jgi:uncharacterized protein (TIGR02145 family)
MKKEIIVTIIFIVILTSCRTVEIQPDDIMDVEGNFYETVIIGKQMWMKENLRTTRFNDSTPIQNITDNTKWLSTRTTHQPAYCWYDNDSAKYAGAYGALYNWYVVDNASNGGRNVCPVGWHVPTWDDWYKLILELGNLQYAGEKLKETGNTHWIDGEGHASNSSGFTARPGGLRVGRIDSYREGDFDRMGYSSYFWRTDTSHYTGSCITIELCNFSNEVGSGNPTRSAGASIRCVKD